MTVAEEGESNMTKTLQHLVVYGSLATLCACTAGATDTDPDGLRDGGTPFWDDDLELAANGSIEIHRSSGSGGGSGSGGSGSGGSGGSGGGGGPLVPECIIWDIDDADDDVWSIYEGPAFEQVLIAKIDENRVVAADGEIECVAYEERGLYKLRDGLDGDVLFTSAQGRYVFHGDVEVLPQVGSRTWRALLWDDLAFEFHDAHVYGGTRGQQAVLGRADADLERANPMRKLALAAMFAAECGSNGPR